ncbi:MAG: FtsQ-type POTRA domain-containing protein [Anaerolineales bacterium]|nr:FtsQ-type POTRA domain-containing protein [Anaerolineales bacterium]
MVDRNRSSQRSDEIRRRKLKQMRQVKPAALRRPAKVTPHMPPPVMARSFDGQGARIHSGRVARPKRRFDVALDGRGAEMRLPALPRIRVGWRLASFLLLGFLSFVLYQFWNAPAFTVEEIKISGLRWIKSSEVDQVLDATDRQVFALDPDGMRQVLVSEFPEFSDVQVAVMMPNTVMITVTERVPVLVWKQAGRTQAVDAQGFAYTARNEINLSTLPTVDAAGDPPYAGPVDLIALLEEEDTLEFEEEPEAKEEIEAEKEPVRFLFPEMVSAILLMAEKAPEGATLIYDPVKGLSWKDSRGWEVVFGSLQDLDMKLLVYRAILDSLKGDERRPALISVEYVHAPYYRLQQE